MSLNYIVHKILKPIAKDHLQINDFGYGDLSKYATGEHITYPIMWPVIPTDIPVSKNVFNYAFKIVFADIAKDDGSNVLEIQSDMMLVAADVAAILSNLPDDDIEVDVNFTISPFSERFKDLAAGVIMSIVIKTAKVLNPCEAPLKSNLL